MDWHLLEADEISKKLITTSKGLDESTAKKILIDKGENSITIKKKKSVFQLFLLQFKDFMILILFVAAIVSGVLGELTDAIIILVIIFVNAIVGFVQEYRASKAMEALKKMAASSSRILRNGKTVEIPSEQLVPGDVVSLEAGNIIPADVRFFETNKLKVDESALTGESENVEKTADTLENGDYQLADRINMGYKGTAVTNGRALAYVVETGMNTQIGLIAKMIQTEDGATPLQKKLTQFAKKLSVVILIICVIIFVTGLLRGELVLTMLLTSISLAVAAIPEALPALVTIALALGASRLVKSKALIKKLSAVETLGSVNFICTDKTGTLTLNVMSVKEIFETKEVNFSEFGLTDFSLFSAMALNNDVSKDKEGNFLGDSTEIALLKYAIKNNSEKKNLESKYPRIAELPFDSDRKRMTTFHQTEKGILVITKGAVEGLLKKLEQSQIENSSAFEKVSNTMASNGQRVLGYAIKFIDKLPEKLEASEIETELKLIGIAGMIDPPREEAKQAVLECKQAGIVPVMITGDHKLTAQYIAKELGIISSTEDLVLTGSELNKMAVEEFKKIVEKVKVYARVNPEQKLQIISALQEKNNFVAMTGDGVNDAPALKNADIGIAMGINGTEVSKEASSMILLDDNFATIVLAVKHGRRIFDNILKFVKYIMTGNSGEIWAIFLAPFFGFPIPLLAIHILWINLVTDGLPGLALASEPAEPNIMKRDPRDSSLNIFSGSMAVHILWVGLLMGLVTIGIQAWSINNKLMHWQTMAFTVLCFSQMGHVMAIRSREKSLFSIGVFSNRPLIIALLITVSLQMAIVYIPFFNSVFKTTPLTFKELALTLAVSSVVFWAVELEKLIKRRVRKQTVY
jgi:P-type Ca2+ transporter type 2C